jgi:MFS family permease
MAIELPPRQRLLLVAMLVDTLGGGLLLPFELVYALRVSHLSLPTAGVLLSVTAAAGIAVGPVAGASADRIGAAAVVAIANGLGALGSLALLWPNAAGYATGAFLLGAAQRSFYGAFTPLVSSMAAPEQLESWFGRLRAARYAGLTSGQALSGLALLAGTGTGLRLIVLVNGASFAAAGLLVVVAARGLTTTAVDSEQNRGYRAALADRLNVALAALNISATLLLIAPVLALPIVVLERLQLGAWLPGLLTGLLTATTAVGSLFSARLVRGRRRLRNLQLAVSFWALGFAAFLLAPLGTAVALVALFGGVLLVGVGEALYAPTADALAPALAPAALRGRYAALHQMAWGISETLAPTLVALSLAAGTDTLWAILIVVAAASITAYRLLEGFSGGRDGIAGAPPETGPVTPETQAWANSGPVAMSPSGPTTSACQPRNRR